MNFTNGVNMIAIINNGKGANEISRFLRNAKIFSPKDKIPAVDAYILSDGKIDSKSEKILEELVVSNIEKNKRPMLAIGEASLLLAKAMGGSTKTLKGKIDRVTIKKKSPILLDLKKMFSVIDTPKDIISDCPLCFDVLASSPGCDAAIIQYGGNFECEEQIDPLPIFGVHFNPELGLEGSRIFQNFVNFTEMWNKYH
jgi:GMP synthase-like glutamine amidotransferase